MGLFTEAPLEKIFDFISIPGNLPKIWPGLVEIKNEKLLPNGGYRFRWICKMFGVRLTGTAECVDIAPNLWISARTYGSIESLNTWTFRSKGGQIRVTMTIDYRISSPLAGRLMENTIINAADREVEVILTNLRARYDNRVYHS